MLGCGGVLLLKERWLGIGGEVVVQKRSRRANAESVDQDKMCNNRKGLWKGSKERVIPATTIKIKRDIKDKMC